MKGFAPRRAMDFLSQALGMFSQGSISWVDTNLDLARSCLVAGEYHQALKCCKEVENYRSGRLSRVQLGTLAVIRGETYSLMGEYQRALLEANFGLDRLEDTRYLSQVFQLKKVIAHIYLLQCQYSKCRVQVLNCLEKLDSLPDLSTPEEKSTLYEILGQAFYREGDVEAAVKYFNRSLELSQQSRNLMGVARALGCLGVVYQASGTDKERDGQAYFQRAVELWENSGSWGEMADGLEHLICRQQASGNINDVRHERLALSLPFGSKPTYQLGPVVRCLDRFIDQIH